MENRIRQLVEQVGQLTTASQQMQAELRQRYVAIAEMIGQTQGQVDRDHAGRSHRETLGLRLMRKVKPFDGRRASWTTFSFQFKECLIARDRRFRSLLEQMEGGAEGAGNVNLNVQGDELSTQL